MKQWFLVSIFILNFIFFGLFYFAQIYPLPIVFIHILSLCTIWVWVINPKKIFVWVHHHHLDIALLWCLLLLASFVRLYRVEEITPGMWGDEVTIARTGQQLVASPRFIPFVEVNYGHATPLLYLEGVIIDSLGRSLTTVRLLSVFFGVLDVALFYLFLRLFFRLQTAFLTALILTVSYPLVVVSRLAYEITPSLFFQILAVFFLYLAWKTNHARYYIGLGLALGMGLYTYIGFRTFAVGILVVSLVVLLSKKNVGKPTIILFLLVIASLFISSAPLISYGIHNQSAVLARIKSLSVFAQHLPANEVRKEIQGAATRLSYSFLFTGDPNPRANPSGVPLFDLVTTVVSLVGGIILWKRNKNLFYISVLLLILSIINDIFSLERIAIFHYYGVGHPNTLRIAGIIPVIYFYFAYGLDSIKKWSFFLGKNFCYGILISLVGFILIFNWLFYFRQERINPYFYRYNYENNGVRMLKVVSLINTSSAKTVYLSPSFANDPRVSYFLKTNISFKLFEPTSDYDAIEAIQRNALTIFDPRSDNSLEQSLVEDHRNNPGVFKIQVIPNPFGGEDALIFSHH